MQITIANVTYEVEDGLNNITIADSAVTRKHKIGSGNGERKIYLSGNVYQSKQRHQDGPELEFNRKYCVTKNFAPVYFENIQLRSNPLLF